MADITLVQQAENSSNSVASCSLTMNNCTVGNTLIMAYAVRGTDNTPTLTDGWEIIGGGNNYTGTTYQYVYFAKKTVENTTETVLLTQATTNRIYLVCGEFSGNFDTVIRNDMANKGSSDYTVTSSKDNDTDVMLYAISSSAYVTSGGRLQACTPDDLKKLQGDNTQERLACWFDNGSGATSHTFQTSNSTGSKDANVECVQLIPKKPKYLIRDNDTIYTVSEDALVEVTGALNAQLFQDSGVKEIPSGTLLMTLSNPEVLCWIGSDTVPKLTATVQGAPTGSHNIISDDIPIGHESIYGMASIEATASEGATFSLSFDNGSYMVYDTDSNTWVASDVGMTTAELVAIPTNAWTSLVNEAQIMKLKATLDGVDTVTQVKFNFNNES